MADENFSNASPATDTRPTIRVLMVDDQEIMGRALQNMLSDEKDISFRYCGKPTQALKDAEEFKPTVILQDLIMPEVDGLTLVKFFRANPRTRDIPMIVLSSKEEPDIKYRAFECGANDYMVKLPDKLEVVARIRYHSKAYINLCERNAALKKLEESQAALKKELDEAENYVKSLLPEKLDGERFKTDWVFQTSTALGGDCFGYHEICEGFYAFYLLDVCGHGVGAALLSVSAMNVLRSQTLSSVDFKDPAQVLCALNNAFEMEKQNGMFFTLWYGVYDYKARTLCYASGGHPPAMLLTQGQEPKPLNTRGMVIGGIQNQEFAKECVDVPEGALLYIFSDGVYEVPYADGSGMMTLEEFSKELAKAPQQGISKVESMRKFAQDAQGQKQFLDDFSLLEIVFK